MIMVTIDILDHETTGNSSKKQVVLTHLTTPTILVLTVFMFTAVFLVPVSIIHYVHKVTKTANHHNDGAASLHRYISAATAIPPPNVDDLQGLTSRDNDSIRPHKYFLAAVLSTCDPLGNKRRELQRTWMSHFNRSIVDYFFILDRTTDMDCQEMLREESSRYRDMIFLDMGQEFGWTKRAFKIEKLIQYLGDRDLFHRYRYVVKVDDNSLIRLDQYHKVLVEEVDHPFLLFNATMSSEDNTVDDDTDIDTDNRGNLTRLTERQQQQLLTRELFVYSGRFVNRGRLTTGDTRFYEDTGLDTYSPFAIGAGYALSSALGQALYVASRAGNLKKWLNEGATLGHWISSFQHVKHEIVDTSEDDGSDKCDHRSVLFHTIRNTQRLSQMIDSLMRNDLSLACPALVGQRQLYISL